MSLQDPSLAIGFSRELGTVVIQVEGELDACNCVDLRRSLADLIEDQGHLAVELDLGELTFIDSSGIQVLVDAHRRLERKGGRLTLRAAQRPVSRVLEICGLDRVFAQANN